MNAEYIQEQTNLKRFYSNASFLCALIKFMNMFYILITPTFQSPLVPVGCVFEAQLNQVYKKRPTEI